MRHPGFAARYHQETKHHPHRYARSSGFMDWPNQPEPFLRYAGAALTLLPLSPADEGPSYASLYAGGAIPPVTFNLCSLGALLQYAMGLSAWKEYQGARWELRCNPSSGNLHPTECYVAAPALEGLSDTPCVYHYAPKEHGLECRCTYQKHMWESLTAKHPEVFCFIGFTSIHWREAWKYGERAYRYCQLDAGHAFAALDYSAAALGWRAVLLEGMGDDDVAALLGCTRDEDRDPAEQERAEALLAIVPANHAEPIPAALPEDMLGKIAAATWHGRPEPLSKHHAPWEIIDAVSEACIKPATPAAPLQPASGKNIEGGSNAKASTARALFLQRRSAQAMDGKTGLSKDAFFRMLRHCMPREAAPPWSAGHEDARVHLALFVHRVDGLIPGLYILIRNPRDEDALRTEMRVEFEWSTPPGSPEGLPLYFLADGDLRDLAARVSCTQDIAGDGAFSLGMLARFAETLAAHGDWAYPWLFREAGIVGQVLYLEAEACGLRATGIGCYFDDAVHELLGLRNDTFQSMYHFTIGGALTDTRLRTLPPYPGREDQ